MLHSTVLWRLTNDAGQFATCRLVPSGSAFALHVTVGDGRCQEIFDRAAAVLVRAAEIEQMMLQQGWREVLASDTHTSDEEPHRGTFDLHRLDRRRAARVAPGPLPVVLEPDGYGTLINVSESGALVQVSTEAAMDADVTLAVVWNNGTLRLFGRVMRCTAAPEPGGGSGSCYYVAIAFRQLPAAAAEALTVIARIER